MTVVELESRTTDMIDTREPKEVFYDAVKVSITHEDLLAWDKVIDPKITAHNQTHDNPQDAINMIVGKWEPPHRGHAFQLYAAAKMANLFAENEEDRRKLAIVVGDPMGVPAYGSVEDQKYPFDFGERKELLIDVFHQLGVPAEQIENDIAFVHVPDVNDNNIWPDVVINAVESVEKWQQKGKVRTVLANDLDGVINDYDPERSVKHIFEKRAERDGIMSVLSLPLLGKEEGISGTSIRERLRRDHVLAPGGKHKVVWPSTRRV